MRAKFMKTAIAISLLCILFIVVIGKCHGQERTEYSLKIKVDISSLIPYQTVSPINVNVELSNIGNTTFEGTLWIIRTTEDNLYSVADFPISNLTKSSTKSYSATFRTDKIGTHSFDIRIEPNQTLSNPYIKLYQDSILKNEGYRVSVTDSIFIHSFTEFLTIVGIVVTIVLFVLGIGLKIALNRKKEKRNIKVTLSYGFLASPPLVSPAMLMLSAHNTGHRTVTLTSTGLILPRKDNRYLLFLHPDGDVRFPHDLVEGKNCQVWVTTKSIADDLKHEGFSGEVNLRAFYRDAIGGEYISESVKFDIDNPKFGNALLKTKKFRQ